MISNGQMALCDSARDAAREAAQETTRTAFSGFCAPPALLLPLAAFGIVLKRRRRRRARAALRSCVNLSAAKNFGRGLGAGCGRLSVLIFF